ncbi:recombinase family protein [Thiocystis minor]|uniref:recombinase family protein n=1 Tax=Thiocystis minor TaxID=61597 RepID=UPI0030B8E570
MILLDLPPFLMKVGDVLAIARELIAHRLAIIDTDHDSAQNTSSRDVLGVWRLDRLGRSLPHLIAVVAGLEARGVGFRSLSEALDTTTSGGRLIFHVFGALGQFERDLIRERTKAGLSAAVARGRKGGRKPVVTVVFYFQAKLNQRRFFTHPLNVWMIHN